MLIRRLGWAGIEIESDGQRLVIDPLVGFGELEQFVGPPLTELPPPSGPADVALVTHLHRDHADPDALREVPLVLRPEANDGEFLEIAATTAQEAIGGTVVAPWETIGAGAFTITAVPAVDGFGDPQVSWVVEADGRRILHCGDTIFHGSWWRIRMRRGPFDAAFLPVNGAVCQFPHRAPALAVHRRPRPGAGRGSGRDPRGAGRGADPLRHDPPPPVYAQVDDPAGRFAAAAGDRAKVMAIGEEWLL